MTEILNTPLTTINSFLDVHMDVKKQEGEAMEGPSKSSPREPLSGPAKPLDQKTLLRMAGKKLKK
jgi:hypothetical protein